MKQRYTPGSAPAHAFRNLTSSNLMKCTKDTPKYGFV